MVNLFFRLLVFSSVYIAFGVLGMLLQWKQHNRTLYISITSAVIAYFVVWVCELYGVL